MPWDPARDLLTMQEQLDSLFGRATSGWLPAAELTEARDCYTLTLEVPGLTRSDIQIECRDQQLAVRGERTTDQCPQRYQQLERGHGAFSRVFSFAHAINADGVSAELSNGVLTITIPLTHHTTARRIDVR